MDSISSYEKTQKAADDRIEKLGKKKGAPDVLKKLAHKADYETHADCVIARKIFDECLEEYKEGEYTWPQFVSQVSAALKVIK